MAKLLTRQDMLALMPGEPVYSVEDVMERLVRPRLSLTGEFEGYVRVFGTGEDARKRFTRRYLTQTREPGKIWARKVGNIWLIPQRSLIQFLQGDALTGHCPTCGGRLAPQLMKDADMLLRLRSMSEQTAVLERSYENSREIPDGRVVYGE